MTEIAVVCATPRQLPKPRTLGERIVVLDIAFASEAGGQSFETVTLPFIEALGPRLRAWIDHHDSRHHARYAGDPRFVLHGKAAHGACPELVTAELVQRTGPVDSIVCHGDFDGLASAAKWLRGGYEPYPGCDADARAIDTRTGTPGPVAAAIDRALRAQPRERSLKTAIVQYLAGGLADAALAASIAQAGAGLQALEARAEQLAAGYRRIAAELVLVDVGPDPPPYDKTWLLLLGQQQARCAALVDRDTVTFAAPFDSGMDFLALFGLSGGMPTLVSIQRAQLPAALAALGVAPDEVLRW